MVTFCQRTFCRHTTLPKKSRLTDICKKLGDKTTYAWVKTTLYLLTTWRFFLNNWLLGYFWEFKFILYENLPFWILRRKYSRSVLFILRLYTFSYWLFSTCLKIEDFLANLMLEVMKEKILYLTRTTTTWGRLTSTWSSGERLKWRMWFHAFCFWLLQARIFRINYPSVWIPNFRCSFPWRPWLHLPPTRATPLLAAFEVV